MVKQNNYIDYFIKGKNSIFPRFVLILCAVEMWERFSFYGQAALLFSYLKNVLGMSELNVYFLPSIARFFGFILPIIGAILIASGHFSIFFAQWNQDMFFLGLL